MSIVPSNLIVSLQLEAHFAIQLLKVEIEDYELLALCSYRKILAGTETLILKFSPRSMLDAGIDPAEVITLIAAHGFTSFSIFVSDNGDVDQVDRSDLTKKVTWFLANRPELISRPIFECTQKLIAS